MTARYNEFNLQCTEMIYQNREAYLQPCCSKENVSSNLTRVTFFNILNCQNAVESEYIAHWGRVSMQIEKRCKSSLRSPILNSLFAFDITLKDAVNKRYIVANAGSNPVPKEIWDFLLLFLALS
jgi:hypothetical protein